MLRQDPTETLFSFLCTVNNSISRTVAMINRLCTAYGNKVNGTLDKGTTSFQNLGQLTHEFAKATVKLFVSFGLGQSF